LCDKISVLDDLAALDEGLDKGCKLDVPGTESAALVGGQRYLHLQTAHREIPLKKLHDVDSVADPGCLYRIPAPTFSIPDPGFTRSWIRFKLQRI
jgi:hypothetical protein